MKKHLVFFLFSTLMVFCRGAFAQQASLARIDLLLQTSKPHEALVLLDSVERAGDCVSVGVCQYYRAAVYLSLQRYQESLKICREQLATLEKGDTLLHKLHFISSLSHDFLGNGQEAISQIGKAIKLKPDEISYYINAGFYHGERGDYKACLSNLEKARKLQPQNAYVLNNLSYYSSMNKQFGKAMEYANAGLKFATDQNITGFLLNNRGFAQLGMGKHEAAMQDINDALRLYPENPYAYYNKALLYILLGQPELVCENLHLAVFYGYLRSLEDVKGNYCK